MVHYIIVGPRNTGKNALAAALSDGKVDIIDSENELPSGEWILIADERGAVPHDAWELANVVFTHVAGTREFSMMIIDAPSAAPMHNIVVIDGKIRAASDPTIVRRTNLASLTGKAIGFGSGAMVYIRSAVTNAITNIKKWFAAASEATSVEPDWGFDIDEEDYDEDYWE